MRSVIVLVLGILGGLAIMWAMKATLRPTSLLRIPRAYTDIFRSQPKTVIQPVTKSSNPETLFERRVAAKKNFVAEEEEEEGETVVSVVDLPPTKKRNTNRGSQKVQPKEEIDDKEEGDGQESSIGSGEEKGSAAEEEEEEDRVAEEDEVLVAKGSAKKPTKDTGAKGAKKSKISRRHLGKEAGKEPNPLGFADRATGKLSKEALEPPTKLPGLEKVSTSTNKVGVVIPPPPPPPEPAPESLPRREFKPAPPVSPLPKLFKTEDDIPEFCESPQRFPDEDIEWHIIEDEEVDPVAYPCHLANISHWALKYWYKLGQVKICTHDPLVDTVISDHLHKWSFWGSPDEWMVLLASGPCTPERPYMLDIGSNLGVFSLIGAERGCHALAFEPLSENIHRLHQSMKVNGYEGRIMMAQHAVGKYFNEVSVGFRPSNPGASGINLGGSKSESVLQVTVDGMLLGKNPPQFPNAKEKGLPPLTGQYINFVKVDTEGYDVAVVHGIVRTFVEGKVPLMLIEFGPGDAEGTAGCSSVEFVEFMYSSGYSLWEWGYRVPLEVLVNTNIPEAINGTGRRVFESWFIRDDYVGSISFKSADGRMKLKSEST